MKNRPLQMVRRTIEHMWLPALAVLVWYGLTSRELVSRMFLPPPQEVLQALWSSLTSGNLGRDVLTTLWRMLLGWLAASVCGLGLAIAICFDRRIAALLTPSLEFMRPLPASAVIPVAILALGLTSKTVIAVIAFGSIWPLLLNAISGFRSVDPRLKEVAKSMELTPAQYLYKLALPSALPDIVAGLRLGLTLALILCIVAEMIMLDGGLGGEILLASRSFRSAELFAGIALVGLIGYSINAVIAAIEQRLLRWRQS